jgi:hypothetical protein
VYGGGGGGRGDGKGGEGGEGEGRGGTICVYVCMCVYIGMYRNYLKYYDPKSSKPREIPGKSSFEWAFLMTTDWLANSNFK